MLSALHRFVRLLRLQGVRVSVTEAVDGLQAAAQPGILADRETLRAALAMSLIKDRRDLETFDRTFDQFFGLHPVLTDGETGHGHSHDDLTDEGALAEFSLSDEPGGSAQQGHSHGKPVDLRQFFRPQDMAEQYNLHQEANRLDMANLTDQIVLSDQVGADAGDLARVQISTSRLRNAGVSGELIANPGLQLDAELSVAEEMALLAWLGDEATDDVPEGDASSGGDEELAALRASLRPLLEGLPARLRSYLQQLLATQHDLEAREAAEVHAGQAEPADEADRAAVEESVRRLLRSLHGAPRPRRQVATRGSVDGRLTMRTNMRYDGIPFRPVTVAKAEDRPRLVVLCDVSLSVRPTARFTLELVHSLQSLTPRVRTFAFVKDLTEITDLFAAHRMEEAMSLVMGGLPAGGVLDVDADSDYGHAFTQFLDDYGSALTRRTTLVVLGDGRGNGHDPRLDVFEEITRRARQIIWLTPEPGYSWTLGSCDLPAYAYYCDQVQVVRGLGSLERLSLSLATASRFR